LQYFLALLLLFQNCVAPIAAQSSTISGSKNSSVSGSVGVGVDVGMGAPSAGVTVSGAAQRGNRSYASTTNNNAQLLATGNITVITDGDFAIRGGTLSASSVDLMVGGNLTLETLQDKTQTSGSSSGFNFSVTISPAGVPTGGSFGMNASNTNGSKLWAGTPSSVVTTGGLSVNVTGNTALVGSMVNSQTGDMTFKSGSLTAIDLANNDELHTLGGGFQVGFGKSGFTGSVSLDIEDKDREGIVRATIGAGTIEIGAGMTPDKARDLLTLLNRDPLKFVEITKDQNDVLKADLDIGALVKLPENIKNIGNLLTALATPVPQSASDFGDNGVKLFKKLILMGATPEEATKTTESKEFEGVLKLHANFEDMVKRVGLANIPPEVMKEILKGENVLLIPTKSRPQYVKVVDCDGNSFGSNCTIPLPINSEINGKSTGYDVDDLRKKIDETQDPRLREILMQIAYQCVYNNAFNTGNFTEVFAWKANYGAGEFDKYTAIAGGSTQFTEVINALEKRQNGTLTEADKANLKQILASDAPRSAAWTYEKLQLLNLINTNGNEPLSEIQLENVALILESHLDYDENRIENEVYNREQHQKNLDRINGYRNNLVFYKKKLEENPNDEGAKRAVEAQIKLINTWGNANTSNYYADDPVSIIYNTVKDLAIGVALLIGGEAIIAARVMRATRTLTEAESNLLNGRLAEIAKTRPLTETEAALLRVDSSASGVALREELLGKLIADLENGIHPTISGASESQKLRSIIKELYDRPNAVIGNGGTADAIRYEISTGKPVGNVWHSIKGENSIRGIDNWLSANPFAPASDRAAATWVRNDLRNALNGK
jgi:hypothetical protein